MCSLCSDNAEEKARHIVCINFNAERLDTLARYYRDMATGHIKPHSEEAKIVGLLGRALVRELVAEWV